MIMLYLHSQVVFILLVDTHPGGVGQDRDVLLSERVVMNHWVSASVSVSWIASCFSLCSFSLTGKLQVASCLSAPSAGQDDSSLLAFCNKYLKVSQILDDTNRDRDSQSSCQ